VQATTDISRLQDSAGEAAEMLRLLANENRLLILCHLVMEKEITVGDLAAAVGLGQSALSQHLAKMRGEGLVATRREGTAIFYRIADAKVRRILNLLKTLYCP
jgi:DNA-binding transcriptional ArsR family regulator